MTEPTDHQIRTMTMVVTLLSVFVVFVRTPEQMPGAAIVFVAVAMLLHFTRPWPHGY
jgi:hypothetical protein